VTRPGWDFDYFPIPTGGSDDGCGEVDVVIATTDDVDSAILAELLGSSSGHVEVTPLFNAHPIFWTRVRSAERIDRQRLTLALTESGTHVRYIASARRSSQHVGPRLDIERASPRRPYRWAARTATDRPEPQTRWRWFLRAQGVDVQRPCCGTGAGTRLAVIDNDGRELDKVEVDAEVLVNCDGVPRAGAHAALLIGWAVGARTESGDHFRGVAPDASPRLYCIPKAAGDMVSLPLAIVRAVEDGADVVLCATSVEGLTSPLLDDALDFAARLGRSGLGTFVVMPTGREMSSPADSLHSSLSLGLAEPASDPRIFCVGPSARDGGWFLWRDRQGKLRPFANRGPAVRWLAPGDDLAFPFASDDRPAHAESSGAAAVASGVLLLILGQNSGLELQDIEQLLLDTVVEIEPAQRGSESELGDRADVLPLARDPDGHNAKHGYGRISASAACLAAFDPICNALIRTDNVVSARRYAEVAASTKPTLYSRELALWAVRMMLHDATFRHAVCSITRAMRLMASRPSRLASLPFGTLARQLRISIRMLQRATPPYEVDQELFRLEGQFAVLFTDSRAVQDFEAALLALSIDVFEAQDAARVSETHRVVAFLDRGAHQSFPTDRQVRATENTR
jgi:hypothetical protein